MLLALPIGDAFRQGVLHLATEAAPAVEAGGRIPFLSTTMVIVFTLLSILLFDNILNVLPYLLDNLMRSRAAADLEGNVRRSRDRNIIAMLLIIPFTYVLDHFGIFNPPFLRDISGDIHFLLVFGVFLAYLFLRLVFYFLFFPRRRRPDNYQMAAKASYTFFILMNLLVLPTAWILSLAKAPQAVGMWILTSEMAVLYLFHLIRKFQILGQTFSPLSVFLYLCGLEILPTGLYVASALLI